MHENRETSAVPDVVAGRSGKAHGRTPDTHAVEESDSGVVPMNQPNKSGNPLAEVGEGRPEIKENIAQSSTRPTQSGGSVSQGLSGVRQRAKERKQEKFTALLHHLTVDLLRESYFALQRKAAPGVDGETWQQYGTGLSGVRQRAKERKQEKFTALLHHLTVDLLRESYFALQRKAAPGVDGETWQQYG